jgi:hypothetical protein
LPRHENSLAHSSHGSEINRLPALPLDVGCRSDFLIAEGNRCRLWVGQSRRFRDRHVKSGCRFRNRPAPPFLTAKHSNGHKRFPCFTPGILYFRCTTTFFPRTCAGFLRLSSSAHGRKGDDRGPSFQGRILAFELRGSPQGAAVTLHRIRTHGHRTGMLPVKAERSFAVRKVFPTFRFAEPLPTVLDIERRAMATQ